MPSRRLVLVLFASLALAACTLAPIASPAPASERVPRPTRVSTSSPTATPSPSPRSVYRSFSDPEFAGFELRSSRATAVSMSWVEPEVSCADGDEDSRIAIWVGIDDGLTDGRLQQIGTAAACIGGQVERYAWWEDYPDDPVDIDMEIRPGDTVAARVSVKGDAWTYELANRTTGEVFTHRRTVKQASAWAQWLIERACLEDDTDDCPLPDFGRYAVSEMTLEVDGVSSPLTAAGAIDKWQMIHHGYALAVTSDLGSDGRSFSIQFLSATPTPPPATLRLDWVRGRLPRGLELCEDGCAHAWGVWPVFGGLAFGFGTGKGRHDNIRLRWTVDGRRWEALAVPPRFLQGWDWEGGLYSDGTATGAFAWTERERRGQLWRTTDRGRTWRKVTGIADWPAEVSIEPGGGRFLATADDPIRLFASEDGWSWSEVAPIPANLVGNVAAEHVAIVVHGDAAGYIATAQDYSTDPTSSWLTTSGDGRSWSAPRPVEGIDCANAYRVPSGYLCLSEGDDDEATGMWVSPDGVAWHPLGYQEGSVELLQKGDYLATSWLDEDSLAYSYSRDGVTWSSAGKAPGKHMWSTLVTDRIIFEWGAWNRQFIWSARLPEPPSHAVGARRPS